MTTRTGPAPLAIHVPTRRQLLTGIGLLVLGQWILTLLDATGKTLTQQGLPLVAVAWVRYVSHVVVILLLLGPSRFRIQQRPAKPAMQWMRGALMLASTLVFFSVLKLMPLAQATALNFCAPLFVVALSPWLLGERPGRHASLTRWGGVLIGFAGMLVVVRPGGELTPAGVALGLLSALLFALLQMLTRRMAVHDAPMTTLIQSGITGAVLTTLLVPFFWFETMPTPLQCALLLSAGVTGSLGHYFVIRAFQYADASFLSPFLYLQIISATTVGYLAFGQLPDWTTALGIAVICAGGVCVAGGESVLRAIAGRLRSPR
ncbi:drug/metabolite transporter (DMT)-like permease [Cupriavidus gilardii J11]|uniref:Drug/metabolite transporter (DMT)-like permease n=1 Tax=Cupriavidus gilardii J11 TaxID=936133 RepID=A0A562B696_9BURK|nr:DMT family transporter [Cupriavidus gilardii]TWG80499.1 drug/metabolite transporter (DMT)-like permease [Cupriavidus gilardii J11]